MDKWEYKIVKFTEKVMDLNLYGSEGWELVNAVIISED